MKFLFKSGYENAKFQHFISCTRFETNYNTCTRKSSENICSSRGGTPEKERGGRVTTG